MFQVSCVGNRCGISTGAGVVFGGDVGVYTMVGTVGFWTLPRFCWCSLLGGIIIALAVILCGIFVVNRKIIKSQIHSIIRQTQKNIVQG